MQDTFPHRCKCGLTEQQLLKCSGGKEVEMVLCLALTAQTKPLPHYRRFFPGYRTTETFRTLVPGKLHVFYVKEDRSPELVQLEYERCEGWRRVSIPLTRMEKFARYVHQEEKRLKRLETPVT